MLDSCVLFKMGFWNNYLEKNGAEKLFEFADTKYEELKELKNRIESYFPEKFSNEYKNYAFDEKIYRYKQMYFDAKREVYRLRHLCSNNNLQKSKAESLKNQLKEATEFLHSLTPYDTVKADIDKYRDEKDYIEIGQLFKGACEGKYKLYTNFISFAEILNHTKGVGKSKRIIFTQAEVDSLAKILTMVTTNSQEVKNYIEKLARAYRNPSKNKHMTPMSKDINSLGEWGDSKIAAVSNLAGINLVTLNGQDFIFDKNEKKKNDYIRQHIFYRNEQFSDFTSDALVYSVSEIIEGKASEVTRTSEEIKLVPSKTNENYFEEVKELE